MNGEFPTGSPYEGSVMAVEGVTTGVLDETAPVVPDPFFWPRVMVGVKVEAFTTGDSVRLQQATTGKGVKPLA